MAHGGCSAPAEAHQLCQPLLPWLCLSHTFALPCSCHGSTAFLPYKPGQSASPRPAAVRHFILLGRNFHQWRCSTEQGEQGLWGCVLGTFGVGDKWAGCLSLLGRAACARRWAVRCPLSAAGILFSDLLLTAYFKGYLRGRYAGKNMKNWANRIEMKMMGPGRPLVGNDEAEPG